MNKNTTHIQVCTHDPFGCEAEETIGMHPTCDHGVCQPERKPEPYEEAIRFSDSVEKLFQKRFKARDEILIDRIRALVNTPYDNTNDLIDDIIALIEIKEEGIEAKHKEACTCPCDACFGRHHYECPSGCEPVNA